MSLLALASGDRCLAMSSSCHFTCVTLLRSPRLQETRTRTAEGDVQLCPPRRDSDASAETAPPPPVMSSVTSAPFFHPSRIKTPDWEICFLHLAVAGTQLSNLSCPGNTTAMNTSPGEKRRPALLSQRMPRKTG